MIELCALTLRIGERTLVSGIDGRIEAGEFVAVLGPNGVGKTTFLRAVAGLHGRYDGRIAIDGIDRTLLGPSQSARSIAFVTSDDAFTEALRVRDAVAMGRFPHHRWWEWSPTADDDVAIEGALSAVDLKPLADRFVTTLSSGERQRVWIAMGLAQSTPVLLLDEPTSHLDVRVAHEILALLRRLARSGKTLVCVLHDLNDAAAYADRLMVFGNGRMVCFDRPDRALRSGDLETAYGIALERVALADGRLRVFASELTAPDQS